MDELMDEKLSIVSEYDYYNYTHTVNGIIQYIVAVDLGAHSIGDVLESKNWNPSEQEQSRNILLMYKLF